MAAILVVDDGADARDLLSRTVSAGGHHPVCAANGWEGLIALDDRRVDLILLDLMMPGMDGRTFLRILRSDQRHGHLPVIVLTALAEGDLLHGALNLGVEEYLLKARYSPRLLLDAIDRHLRRLTGDPNDIGGSAFEMNN
jgi:CheY-like chemotaxis protein